MQDFIKEEAESPAFKQAIAESLETGDITERVEAQVEEIINKRLDELTPEMVKK